MQPAIAAIDRPAVRLVATQQALLVQLGVGARTVKLVAAIDDRANDDGAPSVRSRLIACLNAAPTSTHSVTNAIDGDPMW